MAVVAIMAAVSTPVPSSHGHGHRYYRSGHGYGYWRGGVWITTGIIGYGAYAGSYCSQLYYYDYYRWLYECQ